MNPINDIDDYCKKALNDYTLSPDKYSWLRLFEQIEQKERQKNRHQSQMRTGVCMMLLLFGFQFTADEFGAIIESLANFENKIELEIKQENVLPTINTPIAMTTQEEDKKVTKQEKVIRSNDTKTTTLNMVKTQVMPIHIDFLQKNDHLSPKDLVNTENRETKRKVGFTEVDTLLLAARTILVKEQVMLAERRLMAQRMLAEIENRPGRKFGANITKGFKKIKAIIAN